MRTFRRRTFAPASAWMPTVPAGDLAAIDREFAVRLDEDCHRIEDIREPEVLRRHRDPVGAAGGTDGEPLELAVKTMDSRVIPSAVTNSAVPAEPPSTSTSGRARSCPVHRAATSDRSSRSGHHGVREDCSVPVDEEAGNPHCPAVAWIDAGIHDHVLPASRVARTTDRRSYGTARSECRYRRRSQRRSRAR